MTTSTFFTLSLKYNAMKTEQKTDLYQSITNTIIGILEQHKKLHYVSTWTPVHTSDTLASNPVSKTVYQGINQFLLGFRCMEKQYPVNRWMTFHQAEELKGKVIKGEKASMVVYTNYTYKDIHNGNDVTKKAKEMLSLLLPLPDCFKRSSYLKYYYVFNLFQIDGLPEEYYHIEKLPELNLLEKDEQAEKLINRSGAAIRQVVDAGNFYDAFNDVITLCNSNQFKGTEAYYKTAFHELGHWTGHESRMNRPLKNQYGSKEYAFEELIAELFSAYISGACGFSSQITNNAAYIDSWLEVLKSDTHFVIKAAAQAQRAAELVKSNSGLTVKRGVE
jgi:antirestriction protein ArdC